jgi:fumarate hydratase subunit alpha
MMNRSKEGLADAIREALLHAATHLEPSLMARLDWMYKETMSATKLLGSDDPRKARYEASLEVLEMISENLAIADATDLPMCQDTGMVVAFVEMGPEVNLSMQEIGEALDTGIALAVRDGFFRNSVVIDPVFDRENTRTNLPAVVYWFPKECGGLTIRMMLKGFGSENCSALAMLNPTAGMETVLSTILEMVRNAGGKPCPPIVLGVGLGGTAERALLLSKKALLREVGSVNPDPRYAMLEQQLFDSIQDLHIGPGGFGGPLTALAVAVEYEPTHIAGLPVGVSISCWADRTAVVQWGGAS